MPRATAMGKVGRARSGSISVSPCTASEGEDGAGGPGGARKGVAKAKAQKAPAVNGQPKKGGKGGKPPAAEPPVEEVAAAPPQEEAPAAEPAKVAAPEETDRMRQAIAALRQRRIDLDKAQAEGDALRGELQKVQEQLRIAKQEADSEREAKASAAIVWQAKVSTTQVELEASQKAKAMLSAEVDALQGQLREGKVDLAEARKAKETAEQDAKAARAELALGKTRVEEAVRERAAAAAELEDQKKQRAALKQELEAARKALDEAKAEGQARQQELRDAQQLRLEAQKAKAAFIEKVETLRQQLADAREDAEEARARVEFLEEHGGAAGALVVPAKLQLEAAWEALVCTGLEQMRTALSSAGVRARPLVMAEQPAAAAGGSESSRAREGRRSSAPVANVDGLSRAAAAAASTADPRKPSKRKSKEALVDLSDLELAEARDQRGDKKDKKDRRKKDVKQHKKKKSKVSASTEEDIELGAHTIIRSTQPAAAAAARAKAADASDDSDGVAASGGQLHSAFKRRRTASTPAERRVRFVDAVGGARPLVSHVEIASFRALDTLWYNNPQANVLCERCKRRVPQRSGQLRGGSGGSSFMCCEFYCGDCVDAE